MADSDINGLPQAQSDYVDATDELIIQKAGETIPHSLFLVLLRNQNH